MSTAPETFSRFDFDYLRGCAPKKPYPSMEEAEAVAKEIRERRTVYGKGYLTAYRCMFGDHFHIGKTRTLLPSLHQGRRKKREE